MRKWEIPLSDFFLISGDWGELRIPHLAQIFYRMPQNTRVIAFNVSELLKENQQGGGEVNYPPLTQIRVKANKSPKIFGAKPR